MTKQTKTLIERYTILKPKLERKIKKLKIGREPITPGSELRRWYNSEIRLCNESLELLRDTFNGENGEIT